MSGFRRHFCFQTGYGSEPVCGRKPILQKPIRLRMIRCRRQVLHSFVGKYANNTGIVVGNVPECYCSKCQKSCSRYCLLATKRLQVYLDMWFYSYAKTTNIVILF